MAINPYQNPNPYNQATQPKVAAASTVSNKPPANAFMQGLNGAWKGVTGAFNNFVNKPIDGGNSIAQNLTQAGGFLNNLKADNNQVATPYGYTKPDQVSSAYLNAGTNVPSDLSKTYGTQKNYDVARRNPQSEAIAKKTTATNSNTNGIVTPKPLMADSNTTITPKPYLDGNGNTTTTPPSTSGNTDAQNSVISSMATTQNPDLRQQVINSQSQIAPNAQNNLEKSKMDLLNFQKDYAEHNANIEGSPEGLDFQQGQQRVLQNQYANELPAFQTAVSTAQTAVGQGVTANQNVIAATQPQLDQYGKTYYAPPTSATGGGVQGGGNGLDPQTQASQLAELVNSGQLDYNTASSQMGSYGTAGVPALRNAILAKNPNFNFNLSTSSAQTQQVGQQLSASIPPANQALDALQAAFNKLGSLSGSGIPFIQEFAQNAAMQTGIGRSAVSAFQGALQEARSRVNAALAGVIGVDAAGKQADALLPNNMTPDELPQKIVAAKQYLQNQLQSYKNSGNQNQGTSTSTGFNW